MCTKCNIRQWKLANRHSTIIRNWCHNYSQAKINMEADISALNLRNAIKWRKPSRNCCLGPPPPTLRSRGIRVFPRGFTCLDGQSWNGTVRKLWNGTWSMVRNQLGEGLPCTAPRLTEPINNYRHPAASCIWWSHWEQMNFSRDHFLYPPTPFHWPRSTYIKQQVI